MTSLPTGPWPKTALVAALLVLALVGPLVRPDPGRPLRVESATTVESLARALASREGSARLVYGDPSPPSPGVAALLAGAAASGRVVTVSVPGTPPALTLEAPRLPTAGRRTTLRMTVRGEPGTSSEVTLESPGGLVDTVTVDLGREGETTVLVAVEPTRVGAAVWRARHGQARATTAAWVRPASPVRLLALTGPPGSESRHLVRALEASGVEVELRTDLGRDRAVTTADAGIPSNLDDLARFDVVALVEPVEAPEALLTRWVAERGGGLLRIAAARAGGPAAGSLDWSGPPEILPLPSAGIEVRADVLPSPSASAAAATVAVADGRVVVRAEWVGRGRTYHSALPTWPWVMEAGRGPEHQRYWESVVEWLADGLGSDLELVSAPARQGLLWSGRLEGSTPAWTEAALRRPRADGGAATLEPLPRAGRRLFALPALPGSHTIHDPARPGEPPLFGFAALPADEPLPWPEAALLIGAHEGEIARSIDDDYGVPVSAPPWRPRALLFVVLAGIAGGGWLARRLTGLS